MIVTGIAVIILFVCSPVDCENRRLDADEKKQYKKMTILLVAFFYILSMSLRIFNLLEWSQNIAIGIVLAAILQVPCVLKYFKGKIE